MDALDVVLEGGVPRKQTLAKDALKWLKFHMDTLRVVFQMRDRLKSLATVQVSTPEWTNTFCMSQKMILKVLLLLEGLVAPFKAALELALVALEMPV